MAKGMGPSNRLLATTFLVACGLAVPELGSQDAAAEPAARPSETLPPVDVTVRPRQPRRPRQTTTTTASRPAPTPPQPSPADLNVQSGSKGTVGYLGTRTTTGTKTDTPIINIPQSIS